MACGDGDEQQSEEPAEVGPGCTGKCDEFSEYPTLIENVFIYVDDDGFSAAELELALGEDFVDRIERGHVLITNIYLDNTLEGVQVNSSYDGVATSNYYSSLFDLPRGDWTELHFEFIGELGDEDLYDTLTLFRDGCEPVDVGMRCSNQPPSQEVDDDPNTFISWIGLYADDDAQSDAEIELTVHPAWTDRLSAGNELIINLTLIEDDSNLQVGLTYQGGSYFSGLFDLPHGDWDEAHLEIMGEDDDQEMLYETALIDRANCSPVDHGILCLGEIQTYD